MRARIVFAMVIALVALAATGCGAGTAQKDGSTTTSTPSAEQSGAASAGSMKGSNPDPSALLRLSDVEKATGLSGLKVVAPGSSPEAVGRLNFATNGGDLVVIMNIGDAVAFDESREGMFFRKDVGGLGEAAFVGPSEKVSPLLSILAAKEADRAVILRTFAKDGGGTWLTTEQLRSLAESVLSHWE